MQQFMAKYFTEMKHDAGFYGEIGGPGLGDDEDLPLLEQVMKSMKPSNTTKINFASLLGKKASIRNDFRKRAIA